MVHWLITSSFHVQTLMSGLYVKQDIELFVSDMRIKAVIFITLANYRCDKVSDIRLHPRYAIPTPPLRPVGRIASRLLYALACHTE